METVATQSSSGGDGTPQPTFESAKYVTVMLQVPGLGTKLREEWPYVAFTVTPVPDSES
jgi:hypothetical protein